MPDMPVDLPEHSFSSQLIWVANLAGVDPAPLLARESEIANVFQKGYSVCTPVLQECMPQAPQMAGHVYDKLRSRHMALYRLGQMNEIKHLRPFWQLKGKCPGHSAEQKTLLASDPFWNSDNVPWNCTQMSCDCQVFSLSRVELKRYVERGCALGDEAAAKLKAS
ncbi:hypothetical protein [Azonexus sp.]|uniref:hypothetical protein n=1 Tax=Azonexus sp. TaxID=1872668 RepID=UPI0027B9FDDE|nr:hypothetical protein [Azonexus sp.]